MNLMTFNIFGSPDAALGNNYELELQALFASVPVSGELFFTFFSFSDTPPMYSL